MKNIICTLLSLPLLALTSCSDSLEQYSQSELAQGNLPATDDDAIALVNAAYQINVASQSTCFSYMSDLVDETTVSGENPNGGGGLLAYMNWEGTNSYIVKVWTVCAQGIAAANDAIDNVDGNSNVSESIQQRVIGEAKFLRAYYMNYGVLYWGDYPIVLHNEDGEGVARASVDDVYTQIVADLEDAAKLLPKKSEYGSTDLGRATQGAAYAALSKVLLTWGQTSETLSNSERKEKYNAAVEAANEVIDSGEYELEEDFSLNWDNDTRNGSESIFETQHNTGSNSDGTGGNHLCHCSFSTGFSNDLPHVMPANRDLIDSFIEGDQRKDVSLVDSLYNPSTGEYFTFKYPRFGKYIDRSDPEGSSSARNVNRTVLRYAEVLLIKAEAINERDGQPNSEAYEAFNQVRRRAFQSFPVTAVSDYDLESGLNYEGFKSAIQQERSWEFVYEQKHWFDLLRWRILVTTIKNSTVAQEGEYNKQNISLKYYRYPIPTAQRELNPDGLWQNWGWDGYDESVTGSNPYADYE